MAGFTLVEILVVIVILGILATITFSIAIPKWRERTYYTRAVTEMNNVANATRLYVAQNNTWPPDVVRSIPAELQQFLQVNGINNDWPNGPWPGSVYDWDNWPPDANGPLQTYQITVRFCDVGDSPTCKANAKKYLTGYASSTTLDNWDSQSAAYYCLQGSCRSHQSQPISHAGYCINCNGGKSQIY